MSDESGNTAMRIAASKPSPIMSTMASLRCRSIDTSEYLARNSGNNGARCSRPNDMGAASRTRPRTADDRASASSSAASPSERICAARRESCRPASVNAIRRDVRLNKRVLSFASTLLTAFETVALESFSSAAAAAKERVSATFAKIAKPSRSGSFDMSNPETIDFDNFYFQLVPLSIPVGAKRRHAWSITMIERRPFNQLAAADHGWLKAKHHFSFGEFADPTRMGWGALRVWNDDEIAPNTGFPAHPHANMEIITYVREGAITHKDSLGNEGRTEAGDVQVMSAGSGIRHAEYNRETAPTRIFQIWIVPTHRGGPPSWGTRPFPPAERSGQLVALASGDMTDREALPIRTDARVLGARLKPGETLEYALRPGRRAYLVPARGAITVNGIRIGERDG